MQGNSARCQPLCTSASEAYSRTFIILVGSKVTSDLDLPPPPKRSSFFHRAFFHMEMVYSPPSHPSVTKWSCIYLSSAVFFLRTRQLHLTCLSSTIQEPPQPGSKLFLAPAEIHHATWAPYHVESGIEEKQWVVTQGRLGGVVEGSEYRRERSQRKQKVERKR